MDLPFFWGAATSAHQVEGNNYYNDWWAWEQAGKVKTASGVACDHYRLFHDDIELISHLGHNAHRFSLEWSRFEPAENEWSGETIRHYGEVFQAFREKNIEPFVTLHHFTHPQWFMDRGGWLNPDSVDYYLRYVERVVRTYGPYVRFWFTLNEPMIYLYHAYLAGLWPPGLASKESAIKVFRNLVTAHLKAYRLIHDIYRTELQKDVWVSFAQYVLYFAPCRPKSFRDRLTVHMRDWFVNALFVDAVITGNLFFPGLFREKLPFGKAMDFIALNYYSLDFIRFAGLFGEKMFGEVCESRHHDIKMAECNTLGWKIYPDGLKHMLQKFKKYRLPLIISENGICAVNDQQRARFIEDHVRVVREAADEGLPVQGYFYWSLLDNFEWAHGYGPRFGIVEVDYSTQERKVRRSAYVLSEMCRKIKCHG